MRRDTGIQPHAGRAVVHKKMETGRGFIRADNNENEARESVPGATHAFGDAVQIVR